MSEENLFDCIYPNHVTLTLPEFRRIFPTALKLSRFHTIRLGCIEKANETLGKTLAGLCGEYAAIKFVNYHLGYTPPITFNEEYLLGGDGGWDFEMLGMKVDVKYSATGRGIRSSYLRRNGCADLYILTARPEFWEHTYPFDDVFREYEIIGFIPASIVPDYDTYLTREVFKPLNSMVREFPKHFVGPQRYETRNKCNLEHVDGILERALRLWEMRVECRNLEGA